VSAGHRVGADHPEATISVEAIEETAWIRAAEQTSAHRQQRVAHRHAICDELAELEADLDCQRWMDRYFSEHHSWAPRASVNVARKGDTLSGQKAAVRHPLTTTGPADHGGPLSAPCGNPPAASPNRTFAGSDSGSFGATTGRKCPAGRVAEEVDEAGIDFALAGAPVGLPADLIVLVPEPGARQTPLLALVLEPLSHEPKR